MARLSLTWQLKKLPSEEIWRRLDAQTLKMVLNDLIGRSRVDDVYTGMNQYLNDL